MIYIIRKDRERNIMELVKEIVREYDIRGIYKEEMDENTAYLIGKAYGTKLRELNKLETVEKIINIFVKTKSTNEFITTLNNQIVKK